MQYEATIRLGCFLGIFTVMAVWQRVASRRQRTAPRLNRWAGNLGMVVLDTVVIQVLARLTGFGMAIAAAALATEHHIGIFQWTSAPYGLAFIGTLLGLDFVIYGQHVVFHRVPMFWRFHKVHHTDLDLDVTSALRFHPVEIVFSMGIKIVTIFLIGAPPEAVLTFEILLNGTAMFNHANIYIPPALDGWLRLVLVTPDMHRVHHSPDRDETDTNFGFNLPWWDRLCRTYRAQPRAAHETMPLGLEAYREGGQLNLMYLLKLPFTRSG